MPALVCLVQPARSGLQRGVPEPTTLKQLPGNCQQFAQLWTACIAGLRACYLHLEARPLLNEPAARNSLEFSLMPSNHLQWSPLDT